MSDIVKVKYVGQSYEIPGIWLAGFCRGDRTIMDGIKHWHYQAELEKAWQTQQTRLDDQP